MEPLPAGQNVNGDSSDVGVGVIVVMSPGSTIVTGARLSYVAVMGVCPLAAAATSACTLLVGSLLACSVVAAATLACSVVMGA